MHLTFTLVFISSFMAIIACKPQNMNESKGVAESKSTGQVVSINASEPLRDTFPIYDLAFLTGQFDPSVHPDFVAIPPQYADREGMHMHKEAYEAFIKMYEHALADGVNLQIRSAARNFDYQKGIWERKWTGETILSDGTHAARQIPDAEQRALKILQYSSMPGTSRHHWGTDIDLNAFTNSYFDSGEGKVIFDWLTANAATYGYCRPYTTKGDNRPHGYEEERWHWSYMPLSEVMLADAAKLMSNRDIQGFLGAEVADSINVVERYIFGIEKQCIDGTYRVNHDGSGH